MRISDTARDLRAIAGRVLGGKRAEAAQRLADEIEQLLRARGPMLNEDVRNALCIASATAFETAIFILVNRGAAERVPVLRDPALRLRGDRRPMPEGLSQAINRAVLGKRRAA